MSASEAAATLESPAAEVETQVHRARVLLAHLLGDLANSLDLDFGYPLPRTA